MIEIRHAHMDTGSDTQEAYNSIYDEQGIQHSDSFYLWLISLLKPQPGGVLIDISTGQGRLVTLAYKMELKSIGIDFAMSGIKIGKAIAPESGWAVGDGEGLPFEDNCADYITHIGSLEHYQNPLAGMAEIARLLKPTGKCVVLLPNTFGLIGNIKYACQTGEIFDDGQPLQRYNTLRGWQSMLEANGLIIERVHKYEREWPRTRKDFFWYLRRPMKILRLFAAFFIPTTLSNCLVYVCHRHLSE
jgi:SAM-dependent methyltransferase